MSRRLPLLALALLTAWSSAAHAQSDSSTRVVKLTPVGVTANRWDATVLRTAVPVLIIDSSIVRTEYPNGVGDLFRNLPGVDVTGVGTSQARLIIRGQRGQRILLAEDGLRVNNARRQSDFGELPALTDINGISRVEVVRGPASVLYGTDAIGGIVNQRTIGTPARGQDSFGGTAFFRTSDKDEQRTGSVRVTGREGRFGFALSSTQRNTSSYVAPAGTFGDLTLARPALVNDGGVRDANYAAVLSADVGANSDITLRVSHYDAGETGFGYVDPAAWGDSSGVIVRLLYPEQQATRTTLSWRNTAVASRLADRFNIAVTAGRNDRSFWQGIDIPFTPTAGMTIRTTNLTEIASYGVRAEATKVLGSRVALTYGADWYLDRSTNSDSSETRMFGFGPPSTETDNTPNIPNASYWTGGLFSQFQVDVTDRLVLGAGARGQLIQSETRQTAGLPADRAGVSANSGALVGQVNGQYRLTDGLNFVAAAGRAFRAPNLIERYFEGATPEGSGFQMASPDLSPETSLNVDVGFKLRRDRVYAEVTYFTNTIRDGIRIVSQDTTIDGAPAFRNENIERLRDTGIEALAEVRLDRGFSVLGHLTTLDSRNLESAIPTGDSYGTKLGAELAWQEARGRFGASYEVRHQGPRREVGFAASPVGEGLPAFTVQGARAFWVLPVVGSVRPTLNVAVANLANVLYAEASNTSFFRPEPPRTVLAALRFDF